MLHFIFYYYIYPMIVKLKTRNDSVIRKLCDSTVFRYIIPCIACCVFLSVLSVFNNEKWDLVVGIVAGIVFSQILHLCNEIYFRATETSTKINDYDYRKQYEKQYKITITFAGKGVDIYYEPLVEIKRRDRNVNWLIADRPEQYFELDWFIKDHYLELLQLHRNNYILNQDCLRLDHAEYDASTNTVQVSLSRVKCFDHLVTNIVMDYQIKPEISLRSYYESGETMTSLRHSKMANALGINALVFLNDGTLLLPLRGKSASVSRNMITASLAFGCFCNEQHNQNGNNLFEEYILDKLETRLFFDDSYLQKCDKTILFLGLGRDVSWGGKPHLYYSVHIDCSAEEYMIHSHNWKFTKYDSDKEILLVHQLDLLNKDGCLRLQYYDTDSLLRKHKKASKYKVVKAECSFFDNCYHYKASMIPEPLRNWFYYKLT